MIEEFLYQNAQILYVIEDTNTAETNATRTRPESVRES